VTGSLLDAAAIEEPLKRPSAGRSVATATAATILAYAVTLVQQVLFARALGVGSATDALAAALAWGVSTSGPVGVTLGSVLLPLYVRATRAGDDGTARRLLSTTSAVGLAIGSLLAVATFAGAEPLRGSTTTRLLGYEDCCS
jgi:peptidoglycan biosynthesis protein MviN/MurJ (putative lipid II flippase)